jgi:LuxR family maltose regulon positive regulatory protein
MTGPLLETKLHAPRRRRTVVDRPRLTERLNLVRQSALTLVSAPAGFGKSTLITEWVARDAAQGHTAAWLSLDTRDDDPVSFWSYVVAALEVAVPGVGSRARPLLESAQSMEVVVGTLLNDLNAISDDVVLVLDDFHVVEATEVQEAMAFFVDHLPPQLHVVIASRADPTLPLARMRARGDLVEIRAADLRFTPEEAAAYLKDVMGLALTPEHVTVLGARTEGWIAALQLAALSLQGRDDAAAFIAEFAGDDRFIVDYLVGEVLQRQPSEVRSFLLRTSILDRFTGSLCDALTGGGGGAAMLDRLDRGNLFVVSLDDHRHWYRYHHLFGDMLRARLLDEQPALVPELHRRASDWYEQHDDRPQAIRHAIAGKDFAHAASLIELAAPAMRQARQDGAFRSWLEELPDEVFAARPVLALGFVGALMATGELAGVEPLLQGAERWADLIDAEGAPNALAAGMVVVDDAGFRRLRMSIGMFRAGQARLLGDLEATMRHARGVLDLGGEEDLLERGGAASLLGLAHWANGDLDAAYRWYEEGMASLERAGHEADLIAGAVTLANIRMAQGRLGAAMSIYERGLRRATGTSTVLRGAPDMHVGIAELLHERDDLDGALRHLAAAVELGEGAGFPQNPYRRRVVMALVRQAQGDLPAAVDLLDEAEPLYDTDFSPESRPVSAVRARVHLAQGRPADARRWAQDRRLAAEDELSYVREYEHITLARILVAHGVGHDADESPREAARLLERLLAAAEEGERAGSVIEILALRSLLQHAGGDAAGALASLARSLVLAEPEGYARVFLEEGPPMTALLRTLAHRDRASYAHRLLASGDPVAGGRGLQRGLVEPLSERELDVLRLLRSDLDGPEIARELTVSLNTMRTHTKSIYTKLGVNSRRAAVRRAEELGL